MRPICPLGTYEWGVQVGQRSMLMAPWALPQCTMCPLGTYGAGGTEKYVDGHHGPSLNVLCVPWGHTGQVGQRSMLTGPWGIP